MEYQKCKKQQLSKNPFIYFSSIKKGFRVNKNFTFSKWVFIIKTIFHLSAESCLLP